MPYLALGLLALIWGASFLFIKVAVYHGDMSPATLVLIRAASGTATLLLVMALMRRNAVPVGTRARLRSFVAMAIFASVLPWLGFAIGELYITSALASIINATTPFWTAIFSYWVAPAERLAPLNYLGVAIGFVGTAIVLGPDLIGHPLHATTLGLLILLGAAASYSVGAIYQRRNLRGVHPLDASVGQMLAGTLIMIPIAAPGVGSTHLHWDSLGAAVALGIGASGIAYILYYYLLNRLGATRTATVTFLLPVTALVWAAAILHEPITWPIVGGMVVILLGVFLTTRPRAARRAHVSEGVA